MKLPSIPKKVWQTVALINIVPEAGSIVIFRDVSQALYYFEVCVGLVVATSFYEELLLPWMKKRADL